MIKIQRELEAKEKELQDIIQKMRESLRQSPQGSLRISRNQYGNAYYHCLAEEGTESKYRKNNGMYIRKQNMDLVKSLAQKAYDKKVLAWAEECCRQVRKLLNCYKDSDLENFYSKLSLARQQMIVPVEKSVQNTLREWEECQYEGKVFRNEDIFALTEKGERVRSKSEKILADKFYMKNIPYKYECPLKIEGHGIIYPDFTLLNVHTGRVYYWEHFGMVDNPEYAEKMVKKIEGYERNGIFPGRQLLLTFETKKSGLNIAVVEKLLQEHFAAERIEQKVEMRA